jgi:ABC-type oligopeptide transport system substrate-binding subunit
MKKKFVMLAIIMVFAMVLPMIMYPVIASVPTSPTGIGGAVQSPTQLTEDTLNGGGPATTDPAAEYDTASAELINNAYDSLIFFNGEQCGNVPGSGVSNEYVPMLATQVTVGPALPGSPAYTNFTVDFTIRTGVPFQTWSRADLGNLSWAQYYLTPQDVAYTFDRLMVHSYAFEGSFWLIIDSLLLEDSITTANLTNTQTPAGYTFEQILQNAVQYNSTDCWFNIPNVNFATGDPSFASVQMFNPDGSWNNNFWNATSALPLDYSLNTFFQVWAQQWGSIVSYDWTTGWLIPYEYTKEKLTDTATGDEIEWTFADWNNWTDYFNPTTPVYDEINVGPSGTGPGGVTCGTGPYILETYNPAIGGAYVMTRNKAYWGGWPASWPSPPYAPQPADSPATKPEGWVETFEVVQISTEAIAMANLAAGTADLSVVDLSSAGPILFTGSPYGFTSPQVINDPTVAGVQCNYPIPELETESFYMNQAIVPQSGTYGVAGTYGAIYAPGVWNKAGIPANFFADVNVRKMFAYCLNASYYIDTQFLGRGYEPVTCAPDGFPYINASTPTYNINLSEAAYYMNQANIDSGGNLTNIGFNVDVVYNTGNEQRQAMMGNLAAMVMSLNANFTVTPFGQVWGQELADMTGSFLPGFWIGWLADYSGLQDFFVPYMESVGLYAYYTGYSNPTVDALLRVTAYTNNPAVLTADYGELEQIYFNDVPSVTCFVPVGTHFQRDWVQGEYSNPIYPGVYAYNLWKYNAIPGDVARLGSVNMGDVIDALKAFGSYYGQFGAGGGFWPIMQARWNFYCDIIGTPREEWTDRTVNMGDIVTILSHFGQVDTPTGNAGGAPYWNGAWNETSGWYGVT